MKNSDERIPIVLGTAQLGMNYGIANKTGQPDMKAAESIISAALENGIIEFDTAQAYGKSEKILSSIFHKLGVSEKVKIISKISPEIDLLDPGAMNKNLEKTLELFRIPRLYGWMLHRESALKLWNKGLKDILWNLVEQGKIENVGISVYSPHKANQAIEKNSISMVQIPTNIFDQRFVKAGVFERSEAAGKQIYIRSVYLMGLLLMGVKDLPKKMECYKNIIRKLEVFCKKLKITHDELALGYVKQSFPKAKIILGVETVEQLQRNVSIWQKTKTCDLIEIIRNEFVDIDECLLHPGKWPKAEL